MGRKEERRQGKKGRRVREKQTEGAGERESAQTVWSDVSSPEPAPWARGSWQLQAGPGSSLPGSDVSRGYDFPRTTHIICGLCIVSWCGEEYQCE